MDFIVEASARHVHLTRADLDTLFGEGYELTPKKMLSQPGQFASEEKVDVIGPKRTLAGVSILGPVRPQTQVELAATDARGIGIAAPVRMSGDLEDTPGCTLIGPKGQITIEEGVIIAKRHLHLIPPSAEKLGVVDGETIRVCCGKPGRKLIFDDVVVRVSAKAGDAMHIDTDEANAAGGPNEGEIVR